jgi:type I restriction enzyme S subunit
MTVNLPRYSSYRPSGLSWINQVPAHWDVKRNGQLFSQRKETGFAELPILEVSLRTGVRVRRFDAAARKQVMSDRSKYKRAAMGDIAYNMMRMWQGAVGVAPEDGLISPAYVVASPFAGVESRFFSELFRTAAYMGEVDAHSHGIVKDRNRLYWEDFKRIFSVYPPVIEQQEIVRFIGHLDQLTIRYLGAKQKLVKLLEEQKRAVISSAVTQGLNQNADSKLCGIETVAAIPASWQVLPLVRCCIEKADYRGATPIKTESGIFLVTAKNIRSGWIDYEVSKEYVDPSEYDQIMRRGRPRIGDLLFTTEAPLGNFALVDRVDIALAQRVIRFRLNPEIAMPEFALYSALSPYFQDQLMRRSTGSTALGIKASKLPQLLIAVPPLEDQVRIVGEIQERAAALNQAMANTRLEQGFQLIRDPPPEYNSRLTTLSNTMSRAL